MARKIKNTPVVITETIENPVIDHSSQLSSWTMAETSVEDEQPLRVSKEEWEAALENVSRQRGAETPETDALSEFGPVLEDVSALEAIEAAAEAYDEAPVLEAEATDEPIADAADFARTTESFSDEDVTAKAHAISSAIDDREAFELTKNPDGGNILKTLKKVRSAFVSKPAARVMLATNVSESFINRSVHEGACYNVYALGKIADLMKAATDGVMQNAINIACMKSLFAMKAAGKPFTLEVAKACASKQYGCDAAIRQHLIRHTVAPITAPTQASSTMQAMVTLGIVTTSGGAKNPTYTLSNSPIVETLRGVLAA